MTERVIAVRNWEQFQHYKDRHAPWVKLYQDLLSSQSWVLGTDVSRLVQVASILLAVRYSNRIPLNYALLKRVASLDCTEKQFNAAITHLSKDFLSIHELPIDTESVEHVASRVLASCPSEERREDGEENRGEETRARLVFDPSEIADLDQAAWTRWIDYRKAVDKPIKPPSLESAARSLAKHGPDQAAVVEQSIANTWQGLFALKDSHGRPERGTGIPRPVRNPGAEQISAHEFRRRQAEKAIADGLNSAEPRMVAGAK